MNRTTRMAGVAAATVFAALVGLGGLGVAGAGTSPDGTRVTTTPTGHHEGGVAPIDGVNGQHNGS
jgi:hypothetical protein